MAIANKLGKITQFISNKTTNNNNTMQINQQTLFKGLMSVAAISVMTGCVDNKYDLKDIDTTSRFNVKDLTVPLNLSEIKLENVIKLDDNENITKLTDKDGREYYAINKGGDIETSDFTIDGVHVDQLTIDPTNISVNIPSVTAIPGEEIEVPKIELPTSPLVDYEFKLENVDASLKSLDGITAKDPIKVEVVLSVPSELINSYSDISFKDITLQLPWGLVTDEKDYNATTGRMTIPQSTVESDGKARIEINAFGLDLGDKGNVVNGKLDIEGKVGIISGYLKMKVKDITLPETIGISADYYVSSFDLASFNGRIDYNMENIEVAPISLTDLPEFLDGPETEIRIANPTITVSINNPVGKYGLSGTGVIKLTSNFKNGVSVEHKSAPFTMTGEHSDLAFCTPVEGYTTVAFDGLGDILANNNSGLPESITVSIEDIVFAGSVKEFPLANLGNANGNYNFTAPLGFSSGSKVIYETSDDGWGGDDIDDININKINVKALCSTNLPVNVDLTITPIDKNGNEIAVTENSSRFKVDAMSQNQPVELSLEGANGKPIRDFDGLKFKAIVTQDDPNNTEALGPDLFIKLTNLKVTVDGYFDLVDDK